MSAEHYGLRECFCPAFQGGGVCAGRDARGTPHDSVQARAAGGWHGLSRYGESYFRSLLQVVRDHYCIGFVRSGERAVAVEAEVAPCAFAVSRGERTDGKERGVPGEQAGGDTAQRNDIGDPEASAVGTRDDVAVA